MEYGYQKKIAQILDMDESMFSKRCRGKLDWPPKIARQLEETWGVSKVVLVFGSPEEIQAEFDRVFKDKLAA